MTLFFSNYQPMTGQSNIHNTIMLLLTLIEGLVQWQEDPLHPPIGGPLPPHQGDLPAPLLLLWGELHRDLLPLDLPWPPYLGDISPYIGWSWSSQGQSFMDAPWPIVCQVEVVSLSRSTSEGGVQFCWWCHFWCNEAQEPFLCTNPSNIFWTSKHFTKVCKQKVVKFASKNQWSPLISILPKWGDLYMNFINDKISQNLREGSHLFLLWENNPMDSKTIKHKVVMLFLILIKRLGQSSEMLLDPPIGGLHLPSDKWDLLIELLFFFGKHHCDLLSVHLLGPPSLADIIVQLDLLKKLSGFSEMIFTFAKELIKKSCIEDCQVSIILSWKVGSCNPLHHLLSIADWEPSPSRWT